MRLLASRPGGRLALDASTIALGLAAVATGLVETISAVDRAGAGTVRPGEVARLVGPLCVAAGVALAVARARVSSAWNAWGGLGFSPRAQIAPLAALAMLGAGLQSGLASAPALPSDALAKLALPAPVPPAARLWPSPSGGWDEPDLSRWQVAPAALSTPALVRRARETAPDGARAGVDDAEVLRRVGWSLAWPAAALVGTWRALRRTRRRGADATAGLVAAAESCLAVLAFLLAILVASAWASAA